MWKPFVCIFLFSLFAISRAKLVPEPSTRADLSPITLEDVLGSKYSAAGYSGSWVSDSEIQYVRDDIFLNLDVVTGDESEIFDGSVLDGGEYAGKSLSFSPDRKFVLITFDVQYIWRHSTLAHYSIYNRDTREVEPIYPAGSGPTNTKLNLFQWAPVGSGFAFVHGNDIYYRASGAQGSISRVTVDGSATIINGHSDWVYEEEMFGSSTALWFSRAASYLAFIRFDDTAVDQFQYPMYGEPGDMSTVYPKWTQLRYPKAGKTNPKTEMRIVKLQTPSSSYGVKYPVIVPVDNLHYIATAEWRTDKELVLVHMNRAQTVGTWFDCDVTVADNLCKKSYPDQAETAGWVDIVGPRFSADRTRFLTIVPRLLTSTQTRLRQIVMINVEMQAESLVTEGPFSVDSILGWDEANGMIYFSGTGASGSTVDPSESQIYGVPTTTGGTVQCLTCGINNLDGEQCRANSASFSSDFTHFIHSCSGPGVPETHVRYTKTPAEPAVRALQTNDRLREALKSTSLPLVQDFDVPLGSTGFTAKARLYLPPTFNPDEGKKYPLLIDVYGGPDSQNINQGYSVHWGTSLVTDRNIIYGYIDGRGSGRQSRELMFQLYRKLGTVEIEDQISVAKWLIDNTDYIDANRTGIWGWSYGGYATARAMAIDTENVFKCGISVAPVTSWLYYDTIYTERYMGVPTGSDNLVGYTNGDVTTHVDNFRNKQFFLVHGNADDNVHYQQSMILARALEKNDIMFNQLSYPDEAHGINSAGMRRHLYHSLEKFLFRDCFAEGISTDNNGAGSIQLNVASFQISLLAILALSYFCL